jgi:hypothetical protein
MNTVGDVSCQAVASFMEQFRGECIKMESTPNLVSQAATTNTTTTAAIATAATTNSTAISIPGAWTVWDLLDVAQLNNSHTPLHIMNTFSQAKMPNHVRYLQDCLIYQGVRLLTCIKTNCNGSRQRLASTRRRWADTPIRDLRGWSGEVYDKERYPFWYMLTRSRPLWSKNRTLLSADSDAAVDDNVYSSRHKAEIPCIELVVIQEKRCAALVLNDCALECTQVSKHTTQSSTDIRNTVHNVIRRVTHSTTQHQGTHSDLSPVEHLEKALGRDIEDESDVMDVVRHAAHRRCAIDALCIWLDASYYLQAAEINRRARVICEGVLSVLGRVAAIGDAGSHVVVTRITEAQLHHTEEELKHRQMIANHKSGINDYLVSMVSTLDKATVVDTCIDGVLVELKVDPTNISDLCEAVDDEIIYVCNRLRLLADRLVGLHDLLSSLAYRPPDEPPVFLRPGGSNHKNHQVHVCLSTDAIRGMYNFRKVVVSDCQSHGLLSGGSIGSLAISNTFSSLVEQTKTDLSPVCTYKSLNLYISRLLSMALFMAPHMTSAQVVALCKA